MRVTVLVLLWALLLPRSTWGSDYKIHITPKTPKECSWLRVTWEGESTKPASAQLQIYNERTRSQLVWLSPITDLLGHASKTYEVAIGNHWVVTNEPGGAAFRAELLIDGTVKKQVGFPVLDHGENHSPVVFESMFSGNEDHAIAGTLQATDADGDILTFALEHDSPHGTTTIDSVSGTFVFTPLANWNGETSFIYRVEDCETVTYGIANVSVNAVNDPPQVAQQTISLFEDGITQATLSASDIDSDQLQFSLANYPQHVTATFSKTGIVTLYPEANWSGETSLAYVVSDGEYAVSGIVPVVVEPVNDAPIAFPGHFTGAASTPLPGQLGGSDIEGDFMFRVATWPAVGNLKLNDKTGEFIFSPPASWSGTTEFSFTTFDGELTSQTEVVILAISAPDNDENHAPVVSNAYLSMKQGEKLGGIISARDQDGDPLTFRLVTASPVGSVFVESNAGYFTFVPDLLFSGVTSFRVAVSDGIHEAQAEISVSVESKINHPPTVPDLFFTIDQYSTGSGYIPATDPDGDRLSYSLVSVDNALYVRNFGSDGAFRVASNVSGYVGEAKFVFDVSDGYSVVRATAYVSILSVPPQLPPLAFEALVVGYEDSEIRGQFPGVDRNLYRTRFDVVDWNSLPGDGLVWSLYNNWFTYYPAENAYGDVTFTYTVADEVSTSPGRVITLRILPVNDPPVVTPSKLSVIEGQSATGQMIGTDVEGDQFVFFIDNQSPHGTATVDRLTGQFTFTPKPGFVGKAFVSVKAFDSEASLSDGLVTIEVIPRPEAYDVWLPGWEDQAVKGVFSAFDPMFGGSLVYSVVTAPSVGTVVVDDSWPGSNIFTFTPPPNWSGSVDFYYQVSNGQASSVPAKVTVNTAEVNDAPVLVDSSYSVLAGATISGRLIADDVDNHAFLYSLENGSADGVFALNAMTGEWSFEAGAFVGETSVGVRAFDGLSYSRLANIRFRILQPDSGRCPEFS